MAEFISWIQSWTLDGKVAIIFFPFIAFLIYRIARAMIKYSEVIIAKTRFGSGFVGGVLVGTITSIPEVVTEVTQATAGTPENGLGDDLGSNTFAFFLLVIGAVIFSRSLFLNKLPKWVKTSIYMSLFVTVAITVVLVVVRINGRADISSSVIGIVPAMFFLFYVVSLFITYKFGTNVDEDANNFSKRTSVRRAVFMLCLITIGIVGAAVLLNADVSAFQKGFDIPTESIGGVFLAITTSLPEIVSFFIFMRKKHIVGAMGTITGSIIFNLGITFFGDLAYTGNSELNRPDAPTMSLSEMGNYVGLAVMTLVMILLICFHIILAKRYPVAFAKKGVYLIFPILSILTYVVGWVTIVSI